ncbi:MAG: hypothetical protein ACJAQT_002587 [Akkermansiaceae bacterium]|jgi:hypothetical protein
MANTFGILTALVLAFSAFVAFKNKEEFKTQIDVTKLEDANRVRNTKNYDGLRTDILGLKKETDTANGSRDDYRAKLEAQEKANGAIALESKESKEKLDSTTERLDNKTTKLQELGPLKDLAPKIKRTTASILELENQVVILKGENSRLLGNKTNSATRLAAIKEKLSNITSGRSLASMKTTVRSVSSSLGLVTLNGGMKVGVIGGSKVAVMRGGEKIAELNVTAVSANTATADVIQSSLKEGESVSAGDKVIANEVTENK